MASSLLVVREYLARMSMTLSVSAGIVMRAPTAFVSAVMGHAKLDSSKERPHDRQGRVQSRRVGERQDDPDSGEDDPSPHELGQRPPDESFEKAAPRYLGHARDVRRPPQRPDA
jgi:hypothetical protein